MGHNGQGALLVSFKNISRALMLIMKSHWRFAPLSMLSRLQAVSPGLDGSAAMRAQKLATNARPSEGRDLTWRRLSPSDKAQVLVLLFRFGCFEGRPAPQAPINTLMGGPEVSPILAVGQGSAPPLG